MRSILERFHNKPLNRSGGSGTYRYESDDLVDGYSEINGQQICYEGALTCPISRLFGSTGGSNFWVETSRAQAEGLERVESNGSFVTRPINGVVHSLVKKGRNSPARLIVRDCHLIDESAEKLKRVDTGLYMTEWKFENGIDRVTAAANPRQVERVPRGAKFKFELVYTVEADGDRADNVTQAIEDLQNIAIGLSLLEDDALGGHGSRGYGQVRFEKFKCFWRDLEQYRRITEDGVDFRSPILEPDDTSALLKNFGTLSDRIQQKNLPGETK